MKILKFAFIMTVMVISLISCQKDDEPKDEPNSVVGTWVGKWGFGTDTPDTYEKWEMKNGGELKAFWPDGSLYAVGSWDIDGNEIDAHYIEEDYHFSFSFKGTYDEDADEITGTWEDDDDPSLSGTFELHRQ